MRQTIITMGKIHSEISKNQKALSETFSDCADLVMETISAGITGQQEVLLVFFDGLSDKKFISEYIITPLLREALLPRLTEALKGKAATLEARRVFAARTQLTDDTDSVQEEILLGNCIVFLEGCDKCLIVSATGIPKRSISEPENKKNIRGPRDGFNENLQDNTALIRGKIRSPKLKTMTMTVGSVTRTKICVFHIEGIASEDMFDRIVENLKEIDIKSVLASGYIQNELEQRQRTIFPQIEATERPDEACAALLQGRVIVVVDSTPFTLIIPGLFKSMLSSTEDYYESGWKQNLFLTLRIFAMVFTALLPAFYIAIVDYNPEFVSEKIISFITASRRQVPFSVFFELLLIEFIFEIILEAGVRLPSKLAFTVGIVGTIVLGQAVADANFVNLTSVIIVAVTAVLVFVIPNYSVALTVRIGKFIFMTAAYLAGFFGVAVAFLVTLTCICDMENFGIEYLYPFVDSVNKLHNIRRDDNGHDNL